MMMRVRFCETREASGWWYSKVEQMLENAKLKSSDNTAAIETLKKDHKKHYLQLPYVIDEVQFANLLTQKNFNVLLSYESTPEMVGVLKELNDAQLLNQNLFDVLISYDLPMIKEVYRLIKYQLLFGGLDHTKLAAIMEKAQHDPATPVQIIRNLGEVCALPICEIFLMKLPATLKDCIESKETKLHLYLNESGVFLRSSDTLSSLELTPQLKKAIAESKFDQPADNPVSIAIDKLDRCANNPLFKILDMTCKDGLTLPNRQRHCFVYINYLLKIINEMDVTSAFVAFNEIRDTVKSSNKVELLLTVKNSVNSWLKEDESMDWEHFYVIRMRQKVCHDKGNALIVMPMNIFHSFINAHHVIPDIQKLSFLHHYSNDDNSERDYRKFEFVFVDNLGDYAKQMPNLTEIVFRGCGVALPPSEKINFSLASAKKYDLKLIESNISSKQVNSNTILIMQEEKENTVLTHLKYKDKDGNSMLLHPPLTNIHKLKSTKDLSAVELQAISTACGECALKAFEPDDSSARKQLVTRFFSAQPISKEELKKVKLHAIRATTQKMKKFEDGSMASSAVTSLAEAKCENDITLKAIVGPYSVVNGMVVPEVKHGYESDPKAIEVIVRGTRSKTCKVS